MTMFSCAVKLRSALTLKASLPYTVTSSLLQILQRKTPTQIGITVFSTPGEHRHLYSASALGIDSYVTHRENVAVQFKNLQDKFRERMNQVLVSDNQNMIFTEDLKNIVHLAEPTDDDISLVINMAKKFNTQHSGLRFGAYVFGPVVMRMFHHLNQPEAVIKVLNTQELDGFFDQVSSYQLALDLLYENGRYQEVLDIFTDLQGKRIYGIKYPKNCMTIGLAACYKMNTQESYESMLEILKGAQEYGTNISMRSVMFSAALAFNQNLPHISLEILSQAHNVTHEGIRNLKVLSITELGKVQDALPILRSVLQFDQPDTARHSDGSKVFRSTIEKVAHSVTETGDKELIAEFQQIFQNLEGNGFISEKSLDDFVCEPIKPFQPMFRGRQDRAMLAASFNRDAKNKFRPKHYSRRPGLMEME